MKKNIAHPFYEQIEKEITRINSKADRYRIWFYIMRIGIIVIACTITITSGWKGGVNKENILNSLLVLGAVTTALTSIDTLFQIETKKNVYKLMLAELREIRSEFVYYYDNDRERLNDRINNHLFPKYQNVMAYSKTLTERDSKSEMKYIPTPTNSKTTINQ